MALFTGKGDKGTTKFFSSCQDERVSKASPIAEALGTLDEVNSYLGQCKILSGKMHYRLASGELFVEVVHELQKDLFIIQAEVAGAEKRISEEKIIELENIIYNIEKELPPIKTFFISGGTELAAKFDFARTLARRAERRVVLLQDLDLMTVGEHSLTYLNRLSSVLYALARLSNHRFGIEEEAPSYE